MWTHVNQRPTHLHTHADKCYGTHALPMRPTHTYAYTCTDACKHMLRNACVANALYAYYPGGLCGQPGAKTWSPPRATCAHECVCMWTHVNQPPTNIHVHADKCYRMYALPMRRTRTYACTRTNACRHMLRNACVANASYAYYPGELHSHLRLRHGPPPGLHVRMNMCACGHMSINCLVFVDPVGAREIPTQQGPVVLSAS